MAEAVPEWPNLIAENDPAGGKKSSPGYLGWATEEETPPARIQGGIDEKPFLLPAWE
jgi:hypothetical protein